MVRVASPRLVAAAMLIGSFDKALELICCAARASLQVLADGAGVEAGLGGEVGFGYLGFLLV